MPGPCLMPTQAILEVDVIQRDQRFERSAAEAQTGLVVVGGLRLHHVADRFETCRRGAERARRAAARERTNVARGGAEPLHVVGDRPVEADLRQERLVDFDGAVLHDAATGDSFAVFSDVHGTEAEVQSQLVRDRPRVLQMKHERLGIEVVFPVGLERIALSSVKSRVGPALEGSP